MNAISSLAAALGGAYLFHQLHVPSGVMLGAMLGVVAHNLLLRQVPQLPEGLSFLSYVGPGWVTRQTVTRSSLAILQRAARSRCYSTMLPG